MTRAHALAERLEDGARALATLAESLTEREWQTPLPRDGRKIGVVVHHVASVYPIEIQLAQQLGAGQAIVGVTMDGIHEMNANHAREHDAVTKEAVALRRRSDHLPVHAGRPRRATQLSPSGADTGSGRPLIRRSRAYRETVHRSNRATEDERRRLLSDFTPGLGGRPKAGMRFARGTRGTHDHSSTTCRTDVLV